MLVCVRMVLLGSLIGVLDDQGMALLGGALLLVGVDVEWLGEHWSFRCSSQAQCFSLPVAC